MTASVLGLSTTARAALASFESWGNTLDRTARTAPARAGLLARFEREAREALGPDASDRQIADAVEAKRKAHFLRLSAAGVAARRRKS